MRREDTAHGAMDLPRWINCFKNQCGQLKREVSKARLAVIAEFARGLLDSAGIMTPGDYLNPIAFLNCYGKNVFTSG